MRRVVGVGLDTPSMDHGPSTHFPTHIELAKANIFGLENLADLSVSSIREERYGGRSREGHAYKRLEIGVRKGQAERVPVYLERESYYDTKIFSFLCPQELPTTGFYLTVMPMKIVGGSGAPTRVIATIPGPDAPIACHAHKTTLSLLSVSCLALLVLVRFHH